MLNAAQTMREIVCVVYLRDHNKTSFTNTEFKAVLF